MMSVPEEDKAHEGKVFSDDFDTNEALDEAVGCKVIPNVSYGNVYEHWPNIPGFAEGRPEFGNQTSPVYSSLFRQITPRETMDVLRSLEANSTRSQG